MSDSVRPHRLQPARLLCLWRFSRQDYRSELLCPPPGDLPDPGIEPESLTFPALERRHFLPLVPPGKPVYLCIPLYILKSMSV